MNAFATTIALWVLLFNVWQDPGLESRAVARVQQTLASQYDSTLPKRPFGRWFDQLVGPEAGVTWHLTECVEQAGSAPERDVPACVEATAILKNGRKIVVQILAGAFRQGLSGRTWFHFAVIEEGDQLHSVEKLGDLPQMLLMPFPRIRLRPVALPNARVNRSPPRLADKSFPILKPPEIKLYNQDTAVAPPPPKQEIKPKISKGVSMGDVITRVTPIYPSIAKQMNASGEVQVEITIDENGRVIEAKAVSGPSVFRLSAEEAARKWVFKPTLLDGAPVRQNGTLTFVFTRPQ
ncbi:MAG: energy transducer TonB [Blastocatellia bacterium]